MKYASLLISFSLCLLYPDMTGVVEKQVGKPTVTRSGNVVPVKMAMKILHNDLVQVPPGSSCSIHFPVNGKVRKLTTGNTMIHFHEPKFVKGTKIKIPVAYASVGRAKRNYDILAVFSDNIWCIKPPCFVEGVR